MGQEGTAPVPGQQGYGGGQAPTGAVAHDRHPCRVGAKLVGVSRQPAKAGVAVLDRRGVRVLGRQAVINGQHGHAAARHVAGHRGVVEGDAAADHAASVQVEHGRAGGGTVFRVPAQEDFCAVEGAEVEVGSLHVGRHGL